MDRYLRAYIDKSLRANRAQHLVVSDSKHLYFRASDELVGYQKKPLDPRTCGARKMLKRLIAIDEDTGVFYAELWPRDEDLDLVGFMARAWVRKSRHPMRGFPETLIVPAAALATPELDWQVQTLVKLSGARLERAAGGFGPAAIASREYERQLGYAGANAGTLVLATALGAAQEISCLACFSSMNLFKAHWSDVKGMGEATIEQFDALYEPVGAWRQGHFAHLSARPDA